MSQTLPGHLLDELRPPSYTFRWEMQSNNLRRAILIASL